MGRYDIIVRLAEIRRLMHVKKYSDAFKKIENINLEKLKAITDLNLIAEVFIKNEQFDEARQLFWRVYEKSPTRRVIYQLIVLSIKTDNIEDATELYQEYKELDEGSSDRIILKYCLDRALGVEKEQLIKHLERLKKTDYQEEWGYELAKLYHKMGMEEACVRECSDIILWFGEGLIVEKAKLLKLHYVEGLDILADSGKKKEKPEPEKAPEELVPEEEVSEEEDETEKEPEEPEQSEDVVSAEPEEAEEEAAAEVSAEPEADQETEVNLEQGPFDELFQQMEQSEEPVHFTLIEETNTQMLDTVREFAKELYAREYLPTSQIAKINGEKLNKISLLDSYERLRNGCLLVEQAGDLTGKASDELIQMMDEMEDSIVVILEDKEEAIEWLFKKNKNLKKRVSYNIYLPTHEKNG